MLVLGSQIFFSLSCSIGRLLFGLATCLYLGVQLLYTGLVGFFGVWLGSKAICFASGFIDGVVSVYVFGAILVCFSLVYDWDS